MSSSPSTARRTQVGVVGGGPAGLMLSHLLHLHGIRSVVLESRSREYVEKRVRAGVLEQNTVDLLEEVGLGERLRREALVHHGIWLQFDGRRHRIAMSDLTGGRAIFIYGQQEVVKDLVDTRLADGGEVHFDAEVLAIAGVDGDRPTIHYRSNGREDTLECDVIAGCDGFHGICRNAIPSARVRCFDRVYPYCWLGILADVAPSTDELIYTHHERGFALHSLRSSSVSRLYLQVDTDDHIDQWPDSRIWEELQIRMACDGWKLQEGPVREKGITAMRSFVVEPMQYGRLFLAGDAAHIVPPTGAKGLNLAMADVRVLSAALVDWYETGSTERLGRYSDTCLRRVWRVQDFSSWMTMLLHKPKTADAYEERLQCARLDYVCRSAAAAKTLAENYVGLPDW